MYEDILNAFPYNNKIDIVDLKGAVLHEVLEKSASFYNEKNPSGFFLQVSGKQIIPIYSYSCFRGILL